MHGKGSKSGNDDKEDGSFQILLDNIVACMKRHLSPWKEFGYINPWSCCPLCTWPEYDHGCTTDLLWYNGARLSSNMVPLDILLEHWIEHVTFGLLCVMFKFSTRLFYGGVPGFPTDCSCGVWCCGLTTRLLYVVPLFGNLVWNDSGFVSLT